MAQSIDGGVVIVNTLSTKTMGIIHCVWRKAYSSRKENPSSRK